MGTISALLSLSEIVTCDSSHKMPVIRGIDAFFIDILNKMLLK